MRQRSRTVLALIGCLSFAVGCEQGSIDITNTPPPTSPPCVGAECPPIPTVTPTEAPTDTPTFVAAKTSDDGKAALGSLDGITLTGGTVDQVAIVSAPPPASKNNAILKAYDLQPDGLQFSEPVSFRLSTEGLDAATIPDLRIAVVHGTAIDPLTTTYHPDGQYLEVQLQHFSTAIIYNVATVTAAADDEPTTGPAGTSPTGLPILLAPEATPVAELNTSDGSNSAPPNGSGPQTTPPPPPPVTPDPGLPTPATPPTPAQPPMPEGFVPAKLTGMVELHTKMPNPIYSDFTKWFATGPTNQKNNAPITNGRFYARFCKDAACTQVIGRMPVQLLKWEKYAADPNTYTPLPLDHLYKLADHAMSFVIAGAPPGKSFVQFVFDSNFSWEANLGDCAVAGAPCPGNADILQSSAADILPNTGGDPKINPVPESKEIDLTASTTLALGDITVGSIYFSMGDLAKPPAIENGTLWAAVSEDGAKTPLYRNVLKQVDLKDYKGIVSTTVKYKGKDFPGDICGLIRGDDTVYAIGVGLNGAYVFAFDAKGGQQLFNGNAMFIPHQSFKGTDPAVQQAGLATKLYPWPCRGVYLASGGSKYLYLVNFAGAGSEADSSDSLLYWARVSDLSATSTTTGMKTALPGDRAWRAIDVSLAKDALYVAEVSWSKGNTDKVNLLYRIPLKTGGALGMAPDEKSVAKFLAAKTTTTSNETCGGQSNYPSGLKVVSYKGKEVVLLGHDKGIVGYTWDATAKKALPASGTLDLQTFGQLFMDMVPSQDGKLLYALPMCKTTDANSNFELPYEGVKENADKNLIAILDLVGANAPAGVPSVPGIANTTININGDQQLDHGIDQDYYHLKQWIRSVAASLSIPPIVYTGPQMTVGLKSLFIRGSGRQASGDKELSSSGMGQVQDVGVFDLATGRGIIFNQYIPFFSGLSSGAGAGGGIWGLDLSPAKNNKGKEASVGAILYVPKS